MQTVIGAFDDRSIAQKAVERLVQSGFDRQDIHVQHGATADSPAGQRSENQEDRGWFSNFIQSLFGTEDEANTGHAHTYDEALRRGSSVVVVDAQDEQQADRAASLLHELGSIDVDERAEQWRSDGWTGDARQQPAAATGQQASLRNDRMDKLPGNKEGTLDVVQEELKVGKRSLERGRVRVVQRVSQTPVREMVRLREERAVVERRPADREASAGDLANFREGTLEVRETTEEPVVSKTARVVEEVRVGKEVRDREEVVEDTLRRKDVDVQRVQGGERSTAERERAMAADRSNPPLAGQDPDSAADSSPASGTLRKPRKDKPTP